MRTFNEQAIVEKLESIAPALRVIFAACCAERLLPAYLQYRRSIALPAETPLTREFGRVWDDGDGAARRVDKNALTRKMMRWVPDEDDESLEWTQETTHAHQAGLAMVYTLRARATGEAQEAAYAARVTYEALDSFVINGENIDTGQTGGEARVLAHPLLQREFYRQERDLADLTRDQAQAISTLASALRARAQADALEFFAAPLDPP